MAGQPAVEWADEGEWLGQPTQPVVAARRRSSSTPAAPSAVEWADEGEWLGLPSVAAPTGKRDAIGAGLEAAKTSLGTGLPYALRQATGHLSPEQEAQYQEELRNSAAKQEALLPGGALPIGDIQGIGSAAQFVAENMSVSAPQMGAALVGGVVGGVAGTAVAPGVGTVTGVLGGIAASSPLFAGSNVARATEDGEKNLTWGQAVKSLAVAPAQASLDMLIGKFIPGIGKHLPGPKFNPAGGILTRATKGAVGGSLTELATEPSQQVAERYAAGLPLTNAEARGEYVDAGLTAAALGGVMGGAGGAFSSNRNRRGLNGDDPTTDQPFADPTDPPQDAFTLGDLMARGIAPVETGGNAQQTSEAGALGQHQMLPATARAMAKSLGVKYDEARLMSDDAYNGTLATEYMRQLTDQFGGDRFLAVTAYHAGPGNVRKWIKAFDYDADNPQAFLDQVAVDNPRSAAYPTKVLAAMGRDSFGVGSLPDEIGAAGGFDDYDMSQVSILAQLRAATVDADGNTAAADGTLISMSTKLSTALGNADMDAANKEITRREATLAKEVETLVAEQDALAAGKAQHTPEEHQRYQAVLDAKVAKLIRADRAVSAAKGLVARVTTTLTQPPVVAAPEIVEPAAPMLAEPVAISPPAEPAMAEPALAAPAEPQPSQPLVASETTLAKDMAVQTTDANTEARVGLLDGVIGDPTTRSPLSRFVAKLKRLGLDPTPTADEARIITEFEERIDPFVPDESDNFGIPERKEPARPITQVEPPASAEPAAQALAPAAEKISGNVRTRAENHADTLGSSRRAWFLRGVDAEMGVTEASAGGGRSEGGAAMARRAALKNNDATEPASKSKATWFAEGREYVRQEQGSQARENGTPAPAPKAATPAPKVDRATQIKAEVKAKAPPPKAAAPTPTVTRSDAIKADVKAKADPTPAKPTPDPRGGQAKFVDAVVAAEQQGKIAPLVGTQLRVLADADWHPDNWSALDTAVAEHAGAPGAKKFSRTQAPQTPARDSWGAVQARLRRQLDGLGLKDVKLEVLDKAGLMVRHGATDGKVLGEYTSDGGAHVIYIALEQGRATQTQTLSHEAIHALREMNLFGPREWSDMVRYAKSQPLLTAWIAENYSANHTEVQDEELVAESYAIWQRGNAPATGLAAKAYRAIKMLLREIKRAYNVNGYADAEMVFGKVTAGEIGQRLRGITRTEAGTNPEPYTMDPPKARLRKIPGKTPPAYVTPTPVAKAGRAIHASLDELTKQGHIWLADNEDITRMAKTLLPSARKFVDLKSKSHALARDFEERLLTIKEAYEALPAAFKGTAKGTVSEFVYDSRMAGMWGYQPTFAANAKIDPALKARFDRMPKPTQEVIKAIFRYNHDARDQLHSVTVNTINVEFDNLLAATTDAYVTKGLEKDKADALSHLSRVFNTRDGTPYSPLKRDGNWVVMGRSQEYFDAQKIKDHKALERLRGDPKHYFVDARDTVGEAKALASRVRRAFPAHTTHFARDKSADAEAGGAELHQAYQQLIAAVEGEIADDPSNATALKLRRLATDLYLHSLSDTSARKGELKADMVSAKDPMTGETLDMVRAFVSRGQATTHYIATLSNGGEIHAAIKDMRAELSLTDNDDRPKAQRFFNELMWRHTANQARRPNRLIDQITRGVSLYTLLLSPHYYAMNATQTVMWSQALIAARVGYGRSAAQIGKAYADFAAMTKDTGLTDRVDFKKAPADVRDLLQHLAERGSLDAGFALELGSWELNGNGILPAVWNKSDRFLRMMPQRIEVMNRTVAGIAAYRGGRANGMTEDAARKFAFDIIHDSHGNYSADNAPAPFVALGNAGRIILQFRKFQLIMAAMVAREFHRAFKGATKAERIAGLRAMGFVFAHGAAISGAVGLPGAALLGPMVAMILNALDEDDDEDHSDWKAELRAALGAGKKGEDRNWFADLLFKGAPFALTGVDTSQTLGMGNILAVAPFADLDTALSSRDAMFTSIGKVMSGALGGVLGRMVDSVGYGGEKNYNRMLEAFLPGILGNTLKAHRLNTEGLSTRSGDTLIKPEEVNELDAFFVAMGLTPSQLATQRDERSSTYKIEQFYDAKTTTLKRRYTRAAKQQDTAELAKLRVEWDAMQEARERDNLKRQPLSTLLKAPREQAKRERDVVNGVPTTRANRRYVEIMTGAEDDEGDE